MKRKLSAIALILAAASYAVAARQAQNGAAPRDDS